MTFYFHLLCLSKQVLCVTSSANGQIDIVNSDNQPKMKTPRSGTPWGFLCLNCMTHTFILSTDIISYGFFFFKIRSLFLKPQNAQRLGCHQGLSKQAHQRRANLVRLTGTALFRQQFILTCQEPIQEQLKIGLVQVDIQLLTYYGNLDHIWSLLVAQG